MPRLDRRERGDAARADTGNSIHDSLEVLRKVVAAGDDDRLLSAAAHEELAVREIPEVARREPAVADDVGGCAQVAQVALHHRGSGHENLADDALADRMAVVVDEAERGGGEWGPGTGQAAHAWRG